MTVSFNPEICDWNAFFLLLSQRKRAWYYAVFPNSGEGFLQDRFPEKRRDNTDLNVPFVSPGDNPYPTGDTSMVILYKDIINKVFFLVKFTSIGC